MPDANNLPGLGDQMSGWVMKVKATTAELQTSAPVLKNNGAHSAKSGNAMWLGNKLTFAPEGQINYWYVPQASEDDNGISYCVVPCLHKNTPAFVVSDNFGGCEWHELWNETFGLLAFVHVLRTGGKTFTYTPADGWVVRAVKRSSPLIRKCGPALGTNLAITRIERSSKAPTTATKFARLSAPVVAGTTTSFNITHEDDGDGPNSV